MVKKFLRQSVNTLLDCMELVIADFGWGKRGRKRTRTVRYPRQQKPVVIVKIIREKS